MNERALVLGGAGAAGNAWSIGVVAGLYEGGLDVVTTADLIVGTSSGSTVAAQVTSGRSPGELYAATVAPIPPRSGPPGAGGTGAAAPGAATSGDGGRGRGVGGPGGAPHGTIAALLARTDAIIAASSDVADMRRRLGAAALELEAGQDGTAQAQRRALVASRLPNQEWPQQRVVVVAVDARTGEPVSFDRDSGVALADAVAASTSGPGAPPHPIGENRYIDGGYRANENADLAVGHARVLILSPFGGRTRVPLEWGTALAAQVQRLRESGSRVETIVPDGQARAIFAPGGNQMDLAMRAPAARAGREQGLALAAGLAQFWR